MEQLVQEKERKMAEEQRLIKQKHDLTEVIADCASEEKKVRKCERRMMVSDFNFGLTTIC